MGTAPLSPTQPMKTSSRHDSRNGASDNTTASGRATKIRMMAMRIPLSATSSNRLGNASRPSITNITIWASHAAAS
jgi:hypothetical protein